MPVAKEQLRRALSDAATLVVKEIGADQAGPVVPHGYSQRLVVRYFGTARAHHESLAVGHGGSIRMRGFAVDTKDSSARTPLSLVLRTGDRMFEATGIRRTERPDVAERHPQADNRWAGFECTIDFSAVPVGDYEVYARSGSRLLVSQQRLTVTPAAASLFAPANSYSGEVRASQPGNAHQLALAAVRAVFPSTVLDVGCWTGAFLETLREHDIDAAGLERDADSAAHARGLGFDVFEADLDQATWPDKLAGSHYDVVTFLDVLEHLVRPDETLQQTRQLLNDGGYVVASIPNVAHVSLRLALLLGKFDYADDGLLDRTHLRFFTRSSIEQLFREAGFEITDMDAVRRPASAGGFHLPSSTQPFEALLTGLDDDATVFQYIVTARPTRSSLN